MNTSFNAQFTTLFQRIFKEQTSNVSFGRLIIAVLILAVIIHAICIYLKVKHIKLINPLTEIITICICAYICVLLSITFFNREPGSRGDINLSLELTSILLKTIKQSITSGQILKFTDLLFFNLSMQGQLGFFIYYILNILLFIPWGFILSFAYYKENMLKRFYMPTIYSIITSGCIEIGQLITKRGYFEVEDLITNIAGGIMGAILAILIMLIIRLVKKIYKLNGGENDSKF